MNRHPLRQIDIRWYAALSSLLLSVVANMTGLLPNNDAYTYLRTAEIFLDEGLAAAYAHYPWATYSVLIGIVQHLPGLDLFAAAQWVNAGFYALLTVAFVSLVREADAGPRVTILAVLTILLYPHINEFRYHLIRDVAYLALSLSALLFLVRHFRTPRLSHAIGFSLASVAAALFRPEALAFLLLAPFCLLAQRTLDLRARLQQMLLIHGLAFAMAALVFLLLLLAGTNALTRLMEFLQIYAPFVEHASRSLLGESESLSNALFTEHAAQFSEQYLGLFLVSGLVAILVATVLESFGLLFLAIFAYGLWQRLCHIPRHLAVPMLGYLLVSLGILLVFVLLTRFLTTRYTFLFCTALLLLVPLILDRAWTLASQRGTLRRFYWITGFLLLYNMFDAHITFGEPKTYTTDALAWLQQETDPAAPLLSNEEFIAWQSGRVPEYDRVHRSMPIEPFLEASSGTLLVVQRDEAFFEAMRAAEAQGEVVELAVFEDRRGPRIVIYEKR